jgi:hypothetical protein
MWSASQLVQNNTYNCLIFRNYKLWLKHQFLCCELLKSGQNLLYICFGVYNIFFVGTTGHRFNHTCPLFIIQIHLMWFVLYFSLFFKFTRFYELFPSQLICKETWSDFIFKCRFNRIISTIKFV